MSNFVPPTSDDFTPGPPHNALLGAQVLWFLNQGLRITLRRAPELKGFECVVTRPPDDAKFFCGDTPSAALDRAVDALNNDKPPVQTLRVPIPVGATLHVGDGGLHMDVPVRIERGTVTVVEQTP